MGHLYVCMYCIFIFMSREPPFKPVDLIHSQTEKYAVRNRCRLSSGFRVCQSSQSVSGHWLAIMVFCGTTETVLTGAARLCLEGNNSCTCFLLWVAVLDWMGLDLDIFRTCHPHPPRPITDQNQKFVFVKAFYKSISKQQIIYNYCAVKILLLIDLQKTDGCSPSSPWWV